MRPPGMRPTTPPCVARTVFGLRLAAWPSLGPSANVRVSSLTKTNRGSSSCVSMSGSVPAKTRALPSASAIWAKWSLSVNNPMEKAWPWVCGSWAHPRRNPPGTPSNPSMMCRLMSGLSRMALRVSSSTMSSGLSSALPKGLAWMWRGVAWLTSRRTFCLTRSSMVRLCSGWLAGSDGVR
ncbi:unknown [Bifidobacterium adolescentis CAG:119]|nr:unknown [Bifidobacterium adolescentis CAG:119]